MTQAFSFASLLEQAGSVEDTVLPADEYTVTVLEAEATVAQSSGNPMLKVKFSVVGGPHDGTWIWNNFVLALNSDKGAAALKPFFRQMAIFGIDAERFKTLNGLEDVAPLLIGQTVNVKTGTREYEGKTYVNVKSISKANVAPGVPKIPSVPSVAAPAPTPQVPALAAPAAPAPAAAPAAPAPAAAPAAPAVAPAPAPAPAPPPVAAPAAPAAAPPPPPF